MVNNMAQIFFPTRKAMREASFGKNTDNGSNADKRWARTVEILPKRKREEASK